MCIFAIKIIHHMNRIKELLQARGMSQTELAHRLGKCFNTVNLYATNRVQPPVPVLYQIADILDVDVRELLIPSKFEIWQWQRQNQVYSA